jgi:hypothetical protein
VEFVRAAICVEQTNRRELRMFETDNVGPPRDVFIETPATEQAVGAV